MRIAVCIAAVLLAGCGPLAAQPASDVASDKELLVAYCLGHDQQFKKEWAALGISSTNEGLASAEKALQRDFAREIERLQAYLRAHGLGITGVRSDLANAGVSNATLRVRADEISCYDTAQSCMQRCPIPEKGCNSTISCENENPACRAAHRCNEVNDLLPP